MRRGEVRGEVRVLVLEARGFVIDERTRHRIESCTDRAQLERWLVRASQITGLGELFAETPQR